MRLLHLSERGAWREWLRASRGTEPEAWLVYPRKETGRRRVAYNDAVEEALCFGWIDSTLRTVDAESFAQRFSPRRAGSTYSQPNRERLRRLVAGGLVADDVLPAVLPVLAEPFRPPADILEALRSDAEGWAFFTRCSGAYQRIRIAFVDEGRRRPGEFEKRLAHLRRMNAAGRQFGHDLAAYY